MQKGLRVSIGICAYNEGRNIGQLIGNLLNQHIRRHRLIEIIVVASGCTDETVPVVQAWCKRSRGKVKLIVEPIRNGKAAALNKILKTYQGDVLVHVSADLLLSQEALTPLLDHFNDPLVGGVSGCQMSNNKDKFMDKLNVVIWGLHNETQRYYNHRGTGHLGGDLFAIRRGICDYIPEDIVNDDAFMGCECRRKGYQIRFEDKTIVFFQGPRTHSDFLAQRRRVVYGHLKVKKQTGILPRVLQMSPLRYKLAIISQWMHKNWFLIPHFLAACLLELYVNILARWDLLKKNNPHKIWKVAVTTKLGYDKKASIPFGSFRNKEKSIAESKRLHKTLPEDFQSHFRLRELRRTSDLIDLDNCEILDLGCGNGLIQQFLPPNSEYTGLDFNNEYLTLLWKGRKKTNRIIGEATHLPFRDRTFDVALNLHVIEHLPQPQQGKLISELYRILKIDGQLILSTPNAETWFNAHKFLPPHNPKHRHCLVYSELSKLLLDAGFRKTKRLGFDIVIEHPHKVFKYIPYAFRMLLANNILGLDKHLIIKASKTRS